MAKSVKINGATYENVPSVDIPLADESGNATFFETSADTATAADILSGQTAHAATGAVTGTMANVGAQEIEIDSTDDEITITQGYHNGNGVAKLAASEVAKLVAGNIKSGVTILGVAGSSTVVDTSIDSNAATAATIVSGKTAYVNGTLITGTLTTPTVTQDSTTKVLTIA